MQHAEAPFLNHAHPGRLGAVREARPTPKSRREECTHFLGFVTPTFAPNTAHHCRRITALY